MAAMFRMFPVAVGRGRRLGVLQQLLPKVYNLYVMGPIGQLPISYSYLTSPGSEVAHLSGAQRRSAATCVVVARRLGLPQLVAIDV